MIVLHDGQVERRGESSATAIGVFDGLHLGHQKVLEQVRTLAHEHAAIPTVITFDPHPALVLAPERAPLLLATLEQRLEGFAALGIEQVRVLTFSAELARESAHAFIERVLVRELGAIDVIVGEDFQFGHNREGNVEMLHREGVAHGFRAHPVSIYGADRRWSSTAVRGALADGDLDGANAILGRAFSLRGTVSHGDARGAELGYPTANMVLAPRQQLPELGIYAGAVRTPDREWHPAAISVGTRPQFYENGALLVEVHVSGFSGNLYDAEIEVAFLVRLRSEMIFADVTELVAQIDRDVAETVEIFKNFMPEASALLG